MSKVSAEEGNLASWRHTRAGCFYPPVRWLDKCLVYDWNVVIEWFRLKGTSGDHVGQPLSPWRYQCEDFFPYLIGISHVAACVLICMLPAVYLRRFWLHFLYTLPLEFRKAIFPLPSVFKAELTLSFSFFSYTMCPNPFITLVVRGWICFIISLCFLCWGVQCWIHYSDWVSHLPSREKETSPLTCWPFVLTHLLLITTHVTELD